MLIQVLLLLLVLVMNEDLNATGSHLVVIELSHMIYYKLPAYFDVL